MIGWLKGVFLKDITGGIIMDVGGVGYVVFISNRTSALIPRDGAVFSLFIDTNVREDHIHLYGFHEQDEQDMYRQLLSVQGVGARMALALLSTLSPDEIRGAILASDKAVLTRADGVGPKLANRLIGELKDKVALPLSAANDQAMGITQSPANEAVANDDIINQALSALGNLGYGRAEAFGVLRKMRETMADEQKDNISQLISAALRELGQK